MRSLVLFRNNLRIDDNPILFNASKNSDIIPVYIHDDINFRKKLGSGTKYWLHHALLSLNKSIDNKLHFFKGDTVEILIDIVKKYNIDDIYYEEPFLEDDLMLHHIISDAMNLNNIIVRTFNSSLLWKPYDILKDDGTPYKVFSPFYKKRCLYSHPDKPVGKLQNANFIKISDTSIDSLELLDRYRWFDKFDGLWDISENAANDILNNFIKKSIYDYKKGRDFPSINKTSKLSPYIRFGMISVHRIWEVLNEKISETGLDENVMHFQSEIGWREFSYYLLYHFPNMSDHNLQAKFDNFEWDNDDEKYQSWINGETGFPIIDAGMKELWNTGYMHNRIRMITASFLVKNLLIDWRIGEKWFWDCLLDADYASNVAGWQWVAGTGADAAPYFRIFNPMLQGNKFDQKGLYTKKYLPELEQVPVKVLQTPHESGLKINYPKPIIDYKKSRNDSLEKYGNIKLKQSLM